MWGWLFGDWLFGSILFYTFNAMDFSYFHYLDRLISCDNVQYIFSKKRRMWSQNAFLCSYQYGVCSLDMYFPFSLLWFYSNLLNFNKRNNWSNPNNHEFIFNLKELISTTYFKEISI
ncbi:MAG: hypothetical protein BZ137_01980 [Methanosphaera sp. rholeuAM130]|nr:MAG: hypothetical protein BZ137_01980 [Methanosphaera sp. rholeuAM130]